MFEITKQHRKPVDILKGFISSRSQHAGVPHVLTRDNTKKLRNVFRFLKKAYSSSHQLSASKLAKDMTHFYTMVTAFLNSDLIDNANRDILIDALNKFSILISRDGKGARVMKDDIKQYVELSSKHTTDVDRRTKREEVFIKIIKGFLN